MKPIPANPSAPHYELKNELARYCLPAAQPDSNLKLAWANSVCILFFLIGIVGARRGIIAIKPAPPIQEIVPVVVQPLILPPEATTDKKETPDEKNDTPLVNVVIPQSPSVSFSVPTIGSLVVPANLAVAPPLQPMRTQQAQIGALNDTGGGGERPQPPYPPIAKQTGEQGTVILLLDGDAAGNIVNIEIKESSGFPVLDRATVDFLKRHWHLPTGTDSRRFQTSITYQLQF